MFYRVIRSILKVLMHILFRYEIKNRPEIDQNKRLIVCANHISMIDAVTIACAIPGVMFFIGKNELSKLGFLSWIFNHLGVIYVDRQGNDLDAMRKSLDVLNNDNRLCIFPEGTRVKEVNPKNMKMGIGLSALRGKSDVLCATIQSEYRFRKPVIVQFHPILEYEHYRALGSKLGREEFSKDIFNTIYSTNFSIEEFYDRRKEEIINENSEK